jgi:type I restriction enzyme S subunit
MRSTSNNFPKEWKIVRLEDVAEVSSGNTAPQNRIYFENGKYPFIRVQHINTLIENKYPVIYDLVNDLAVKKLKLKVFRKGSIIFPKSGESIKLEKRAILKEDSCVVNHLAVIEVFSNDLDANFLFYYLSNIKTSNYLSKTTMPSLNLSVIKSFSVPLPPLPEQRKIAEILSTVDKAIQKVDEVIQRTEKLKRGLMQELLTKGIGHKEFKNTEIGRIPKQWKVVRLGDEGIAEIRSNRVISGFEKVAFIPMELIPDSCIFANYELRPMDEVKSFTYCERGDLLLAKITPSLENGKQGIVPDDVPNGFALATTEVFPIVPKGVDKLYLFYLLKFSKFRNKIIASMIGTTGRQRASKESVEKLKIPLPPLPEQRKIAEILSTVDKKLELEKKKKEKLKHVKKGLMSYLLTGRRRVEVVENE